MNDILCSIPWHCGNKDGCTVGWHKRTFWTAESGYTVDEYSDGDHDECDEEDLPSAEEEISAWAEYSRFVMKTGTDPLGECIVKRSEKVSQKWLVSFTQVVGGAILSHARRNGRMVPLAELPDHVLQYLACERVPTNRLIRSTMSWEDLEKVFPNPRKRNSVTIEWDRPIPEEVVARELREAAARWSKTS